jgi:hypothetical protein
MFDLAAAGLTAYASLKSVAGTISDITKTAGATAALGRIADLAGVNPQRSAARRLLWDLDCWHRQYLIAGICRLYIS